MKKTGNLLLEDGTLFTGHLIGASEVFLGEAVFSTSMTGYTEVLSDPSYFGQIVILSNPEIGNYGVSFDDLQSLGIKVKGLVVRNLSTRTSSHRSQITLRDWLLRENIPVLFGVDTRALITLLREKGSLRAGLCHKELCDPEELLRLVKKSPSMDNACLSPMVAVKEATKIKSTQNLALEKISLVVLDFGIKKSLLNELDRLGCEISLLPPKSSLEDIWEHKPDALFLSNGPGDPKTETVAVATVRSILGKLPIFGVCLGHQILAQALGLKTYRLSFGHRGSNHPVKGENDEIWITAQNHGFAVESSENLKANNIENLSDLSNEGLFMPEIMAFSLQFHPEGAPGPRDSIKTMENFVELAKSRKKNLKPGRSLEVNHRNIGESALVEGWC